MIVVDKRARHDTHLLSIEDNPPGGLSNCFPKCYRIDLLMEILVKDETVKGRISK